MDSQFVSIIVPIYNCEKYLPECLESILKQKYKNFELLLINDGSTDKSKMICEQYAKTDSRIKVFNKENGGVSSARNFGIDHAKGDYVVFIDSDDYIGSSYLSTMLQFADLKDSIILTDYQPFNAGGFEKRQFGKEYNISFDDSMEDPAKFESLVFDFQIFPPYCKLYSRKVIEENCIRFNENLKSAEDFDFNIRYLEHMKKLYYRPVVQYYYRVGYKNYVPSNRGVLGNSEILSAHIMCDGIIRLANRMGVYDGVEKNIALWAANKHYFNRMRMLFAYNKEVGYKERIGLYRQLIHHENYHRMYKKGIPFLPKSTTKWIASHLDFFAVWWLFYKLHRKVS